MKWLEVTTLLLAALVAPVAAQAQGELVEVAALESPERLERGYASQIFQTTAHVLRPTSLEDLAAGELHEVTLVMSGGSSMAQTLKKAFENRRPMDRLVLSAIEPGGRAVELKSVRVTSYSLNSSGDATMIMGFMHMAAGTQDAMKRVLFGAAGVTGGLAGSLDPATGEEKPQAITSLRAHTSTEAVLLDPDIEALKADSGRRMTLAVPASSPAARVLKEAFRNRRPLGDLVLRASEDGAILIVSAADGPMPTPDGTTEHFFTIRVSEGTVASVRPHTPRGGLAMEAITIAYESIQRVE